MGIKAKNSHSAVPLPRRPRVFPRWALGPGRNVTDGGYHGLRITLLGSFRKSRCTLVSYCVFWRGSSFELM